MFQNASAVGALPRGNTAGKAYSTPPGFLAGFRRRISAPQAAALSGLADWGRR